MTETVVQNPTGQAVVLAAQSVVDDLRALLAVEIAESEEVPC